MFSTRQPSAGTNGAHKLLCRGRVSRVAVYHDPSTAVLECGAGREQVGRLIPPTLGNSTLHRACCVLLLSLRLFPRPSTPCHYPNILTRRLILPSIPPEAPVVLPSLHQARSHPDPVVRLGFPPLHPACARGMLKLWRNTSCAREVAAPRRHQQTHLHKVAQPFHRAVAAVPILPRILSLSA